MAPKRLPLKSLSKSGKYFRTHPKANANKDRISKRVNARPEQRAKRSELSTIRRKAIRNGVDTSKSDYDHAAGKRVSIKTNRGRLGEGQRKRKKK